MARPRKQKHDPRQLTFSFDVMADHIEQIRQENVQADKQEETSLKSAVKQVEETPVTVLPVNEPVQEGSPPYVRLGLNSEGVAVYALHGGGRMVSRNLELMQTVDGDKNTPEQLFHSKKHRFLTVAEVMAFTKE